MALHCLALQCYCENAGKWAAQSYSQPQSQSWRVHLTCSTGMKPAKRRFRDSAKRRSIFRLVSHVVLILLLRFHKRGTRLVGEKENTLVHKAPLHYLQIRNYRTWSKRDGHRPPQVHWMNKSIWSIDFLYVRIQALSFSINRLRKLFCA